MTTINGKACVVNGRNLLTGTSSELKTKQLTNAWNVGPQATNGNFKIKVFKGQTYTYRAWLDNTNGPANVFVDVRFLPTTEGATDIDIANGTPIKKGETGYSTSVFTPPEDGYLKLAPFSYSNRITVLAGWKEEKLEKGNTPTPWIPVPVDKVFSNGRQVYGRNMLTGTGNHTVTGTGRISGFLSNEITDDFLTLFKRLEGQTVTVSVDYEYSGFIAGSRNDRIGWQTKIIADTTTYFGAWYDNRNSNNSSGSGRISSTFVVPKNITDIGNNMGYIQFSGSGTGTLSHLKLEKGGVATPWCPNPADSDYNSWRYNLSGNVFIPYSGTVPCNQLEQGFTIEMTAKDASSSLSFKINDSELAYSGAVTSGDVFMFSGFSYTQNRLSIVSKTNKAYFILQPDKPNRITCNVPGAVRILGFQNLYA